MKYEVEPGVESNSEVTKENRKMQAKAAKKGPMVWWTDKECIRTSYFMQEDTRVFVTGSGWVLTSWFGEKAGWVDMRHG